MRHLLLVIALLVALAVAQHTCPFNADNEAFNYATPQPNVSLNACAAFSELACCTPEYDAQVAAGTDALSSSFLAGLRADSVSAACRAAITQLACLRCSATQDQWSTVLPDIVTSVRVCTDFCDTLYAACSSAVLDDDNDDDGDDGDDGDDDDDDDDTVGSAYASGAVLCYERVLPSGVTVEPAAAGQCYAPDEHVCTAADFVAAYSQCDPATNTRSLVYYLPPHSHCTGGAVPPPIAGLPCDLVCAPGSYLTPGEAACRNCSAGSFSVGNGFRIQQWNEWPDEQLRFFMSCRNASQVWSPCRTAWVLAGSWVRVNASLGDDEGAALSAAIRLEAAGSVTFEVRVSAEINFDGLVVFINGAAVLGSLARPLGVTVGFQRYSFALEKGLNFMQWIYVKDVSLSRGDDAAFIRLIQITGTGTAVAHCSPCPAGTASGAAAAQCDECPRGSFAPAGSAECTKCDKGWFSFDGAASCTAQLPCARADYAQLNSTCAGGLMHVVWQLLDGSTCDPSLPGSFVVPTSTPDTPCGPCPTGLVRAAASDECVACPAGAVPDESGVCVPCAAATYADEAMAWTRYDWDSWRYGETTGCLGECGSSGWRLRGDRVDSGVNHGFDGVQSWFEVPFEVTPLDGANASDVSLEIYWYLLDGSVGDAWLEFDLDAPAGSSGLLHETLQATSTGARNAQTVFFAGLDAGKHVLRISYESFGGVLRTQRAEIWRMFLHGVSSGSGLSCRPCSPGAVAPAGSAQCTWCPPGTYGPAGAADCLPCPENTFNAQQGQSSCKPCGQNTYTPEGSTYCANSCQFSTAPGASFDLLPLATDSMYGPVRDTRNFLYYFNPCSLQHDSHTCYDSEGVSVPTFVCQTGLVNSIGTDLGHVAAYSVNTTSTRGGFIAKYSNGKTCANGAQRSTTVRFVCNPTAGVGVPVADTILENRCDYYFVWQSLYACPLCTAADYYEIPGECDESNRQQVVYAWRSHPARCHDGVPLPATITRPCAVGSQKRCGLGKWLDAQDQCHNASVGYFTSGGQSVYAVFTEGAPLTPPWSTSCGYATGTAAVEPCTPWRVHRNYLRSGTGRGAFSMLQLSANLVRPGSIRISYRLSGSLQQPLYMRIDSQAATQLTSMTFVNGLFAYQTTATPLVAGLHAFTFWVNDSSLTVATITNVTIDGTRWSSLGETPCPAGFVAPVEGRAVCDPCPAGTYASADADKCVPCANHTYSQSAWSACLPLGRVCEADDFAAVPLSPCDPQSQTQTLTYQLVPSARCIADGVSPPADEVVSCRPCRVGEVYNADTAACTRCPAGQIFLTAAGACALPTAGTHTTPTMASPALSYTWPEGFKRGCDGEACDASLFTRVAPSAAAWSNFYGWRMRGGRFVLRQLPGQGLADAYFSASVIVGAQGGLVSFSYSGSVSFFVQGRPVVLGTSPVTISLPYGPLVLIWSYHYDTDSAGQGGLGRKRAPVALAVVSDIRIVNVQNAPLIDETPCAAGTYAPVGGLPTCRPCPAGNYSLAGAATCSPCVGNSVARLPGSGECEPCAAGTGAALNKQSCPSSCKFAHSGETYDLTYMPPVSRIALASGSVLTLSMCTPNQFCGATAVVQHVCVVDPNAHTSFPAGTSLTVEFFNDTAHTMSLVYSTPPPTTAPPVGTPAVACPGGRTTALTLHCVSDAYRDAYEVFSSECAIILRANSRAACPVCKESDYVSDGLLAGCSVPNAKFGHYNFFPSRVCQGVDTKQGPSNVPCPKANGKKPQLSAGAIVGIVFAVLVTLVILIALIIAALVYWGKNWQLQSAVERLTSAAASAARGGGRRGDVPLAQDVDEL